MDKRITLSGSYRKAGDVLLVFLLLLKNLGNDIIRPLPIIKIGNAAKIKLLTYFSESFFDKNSEYQTQSYQKIAQWIVSKCESRFICLFISEGSNVAKELTF